MTAPALHDSLAQLALDLAPHIDEARWLALSQELIPAGQPAAENPLDPDQPHGHEEGIANVVADKLRALGFEVQLIAKRPGRPNVVGTLKGRAGGPSLILNDHLDTYPAGDPTKWTRTGGNPYQPTRDGDFLFARGTSDTRANLACTLLAVEALLATGWRPRGTLQCIYTVDEEKNGPDGSIFLLDEIGIRADYEITCEPTGWTRPDNVWGMGIALANSGHFLAELTLTGLQAHLWRPDTALNPVDHLPAVLKALNEVEFRHQPPKRYGGTPPRVTVLRVRAGEPREMQFTPGEATLVLGLVGLVPGMTQTSVLEDVERAIAPLREQVPGLGVELKPYPNALFVNATIEQDENAEPVTSLRAAYRAVLGDEPELYRKNAFNDTIRFSERGIPAVTFGPGEDGWPPINEYIRIEKSVAATRILALTVASIVGVDRA